MIVRQDDGRYAHVPGCNEHCREDGHWLEQSVPASLPDDVEEAVRKQMEAPRA